MSPFAPPAEMGTWNTPTAATHGHQLTVKWVLLLTRNIVVFLQEAISYQLDKQQHNVLCGLCAFVVRIPSAFHAITI